MRARGFTLLETLVALALTALVLGALGGAVLRAASARTRATDAADRAAAARTVLLRLAAEIEAAQPPAPEDPAGRERFVVEPEASARPWSGLRLATAIPGPPLTTTPTGDVRVVGYRVEPDPQRPGTGALVRRDAPPGAPEPPGHPVLEGVHRFRLRCFDGSTWSATWPASRLPRAVEVALGVDDGRGGVEELAVTVTLPAAG